MKWLVYNVLFLPAFAAMLPAFLLRMCRRGGYRARMGDRFALYPKGLFDLPEGAKPYVWIHAVSVGEVQVAGQLMREWRTVESGVRFCFSTTSSTGWKMAEREIGPDDVLIYNPLDFPTFVKAALETVRPRAVILTESEIWPNFIRRAKKSGAPVFLVNARVSDRSAPRYKAARFLFRDIFGCFSRIYAQSRTDRERLIAAGAPSGAVDVTGSFKFDVARRNAPKEKELLEWMTSSGRLPEGAKILLGGSTWPGEDNVLLRMLQRLPGAVLVLAPRHFEKADAVEANILAAGYSCLRRSSGRLSAPPGESCGTVFLADTTGELMGLYAIADVVFVGKSLCARGSQNMIEPCLCAKPVLVGPHTENFRPVMSDLLEMDAIRQVKDELELSETLAGIFENGDGGLGERAAKAVVARKGVVGRCVADIRGRIASAPRRAVPGRPGVLRTVVLSAAFLLAVLGALFFALSGDDAVSRPSYRKPARTEIPKPAFVKTASAFAAAVMKPDAAKVLVAGDADGSYCSIFSNLSFKVSLPDSAAAADALRHDIVFLAPGVSRSEIEKCFAKISEKGVLAQMVDVEGMSAGEFKRLVDDFPCGHAHLWMVSRTDWLLVGRMTPRKLKLGSILEFFTRSGALSAEAEEAGCGSVQGVFANYVGSFDEIRPAFEGGDLDVVVLPEFFVMRDVPGLEWISPADLDQDVVDSIASQIRETMSVRRAVVSAESLARRKDGCDRALDMWAGAMKRNPCDTMLLDRLYRLAVNARVFRDIGKLAEAARCYETMIAIRPTDVPVIEEYAQLLIRLGKRDLATEVLRKACEMKSATSSPAGGARYDS